MIEGFLKILREWAGKASVLLVASRVDVSFIAKPFALLRSVRNDGIPNQPCGHPARPDKVDGF
jgi:hypothetical protein